MVHLNRITTRTGDDGSTGLGDGSRVAKTHPRIIAIGSVDELNAALGMAAATKRIPRIIAGCLSQIQNDLFDAGAELCVPAGDVSGADAAGRLHITPAYVDRLDRHIDETVERLAPLNSFILPGGNALASRLHVARTVCRRAERDVLALAETQAVSLPLRLYLNRLSDLLFLFARLANDGGHADVLWQPGRGAQPTPDQ